MSTLRVAAINNPSASSGGLAISASGNVTGAGLDLITTQSFSATTALVINNVFSSTYSNYRVSIDFTAISANGATFARLRSGGVANTSSYRTEQVENYGATVSASQNPNGNGTVWTILSNAGSAYGDSTSANFDLNRPGIAAQTSGFCRATMITSSGVFVATNGTLWHGVASAFDGISIEPNLGTISGTIRIYGYRN